MGGRQKSVYIRFNMENKADCDLYLKLAEAAGDSASLTAYVKRALGEYVAMNLEMTERQEFHEQILSEVREEMQTQGMKLVGALLAGIGTINVLVKQDEPTAMETELPEACGELPEELSGVLDLIG